jgi:glycosyltransferase involved in cell wall biosynthesis
MASISVIIPARNAKAYLERTLPAVLAAASAHGRAEVIVVDNGSKDGTADFVRAAGGDAVRFLECPDARVGGVRNRGVEVSSGASLAFIDADCLIDPGWLLLLDEILADPAVAGAGAPYDLPDDPAPLEEAWQLLHELPRDGPAAWLFGGNCGIRREAFLAVGGFDSTLESGEDAELGMRLRRAGNRLVTRRGLRARHLGNPKTWRAFFRQQVWHGMGMFGTMRVDWLDRPTLMLLAFIAAHVLAVSRFAGAPARVAAWLPAVVLVFLVPLAAVLYRVASGGKARRPLTAVGLYYVYFAARSVALLRIAGAALGRALHRDRSCAARSS